MGAAVLLTLIPISLNIPTDLTADQQASRLRAVCAALKVHGKSLANLHAHHSFVKCQFSKPELANTLATAEVLKRCRTNLKIDAQCVATYKQGFTREQKPKFCSGLVSMKKLFENVRKIVCSREASTYINSLSNQINMAKKK